VAVGCLDDRLQLALLLRQCVEVGVRLRVGGIDLVELRECVLYPGHRLLDVPAHVQGRIELRLLGQIAYLDARLRPCLALDLGVDTGHDPKQGGLARAVESEHADLGAGEEGKGDVVQDPAPRRHGLADTEHGVDVLGHE